MKDIRKDCINQKNISPHQTRKIRSAAGHKQKTRYNDYHCNIILEHGCKFHQISSFYKTMIPFQHQTIYNCNQNKSQAGIRMQTASYSPLKRTESQQYGKQVGYQNCNQVCCQQTVNLQYSVLLIRLIHNSFYPSAILFLPSRTRHIPIIKTTSIFLVINSPEENFSPNRKISAVKRRRSSAASLLFLFR